MPYTLKRVTQGSLLDLVYIHNTILLRKEQIPTKIERPPSRY